MYSYGADIVLFAHEVPHSRCPSCPQYFSAATLSSVVLESCPDSGGANAAGRLGGPGTQPAVSQGVQIHHASGAYCFHPSR